MKLIKKQRSNLLSAVEDGLPYKHVREKLEKLDAQQDRLERKISDLQRKQETVSKEELLDFFADVADGYKSDADLLKAFVTQVWAFGDELLVVMNFQGRYSTPYEIKRAYKKHEPAGQAPGSCDLSLVPLSHIETTPKNTVSRAAKGMPVILLENGIGVLISLKAA